MAKDPLILVIDDEEEICGFLKDLFTAEGYTVHTATEPEKGLELAQDLRPDVVLLDLKMPRMDGIEVLRRIKKIDEAIAVIIITGFGTMDSARAAIRLGAFDYITKPFDLSHVKALVKDALAYRISAVIEELKAGRGLLNKKETAFLNSIPKCRREGACLWEMLVRAFLLGDARSVAQWMEQPNIPQEDKENLKRLTEILENMFRRVRRKEGD
jgi:DNA-binding NtrC family response regulator